MTKWIAEFELEDGDTMPEHMDLEYKGAKLDFHCRPTWIPISTGKFPPSFEACEVTVVRKDKTWNQKPYIRLAEWNDELRDWFIIPYSITRLHGERLSESDGGDATVIAWRHLTEPYKEDEII